MRLIQTQPCNRRSTLYKIDTGATTQYEKLGRKAKFEDFSQSTSNDITLTPWYHLYETWFPGDEGDEAESSIDGNLGREEPYLFSN